MNLDEKIIAAVREDDAFEVALASKVKTLFFLNPDIAGLQYAAKKAHQCGKELYIHVDLTAGLGKDASGIAFAKNVEIDGIISTRTNLIKIAKEYGLHTVQRFFMVDSQSVQTLLESIRVSKAERIEIMPGVIPKLMQSLRLETDTPIIAGGLIETQEEVEAAFQGGASAISTGCIELWG